ncbi:hypothetical protein BLNAU_13063 [Blattamonas nauphoetae]|uniref:Uncharacterized protein n=1 Tax=Blattamonas nauphoetae TaxID=2049346 RepID=A0ABQ9XKU8_9EUKA|nr:hypothetical protein BLNAU_13063 [Blattamonas nauphoetae]
MPKIEIDGKTQPKTSSQTSAIDQSSVDATPEKIETTNESTESTRPYTQKDIDYVNSLLGGKLDIESLLGDLDASADALFAKLDEVEKEVDALSSDLRDAKPS